MPSSDGYDNLIPMSERSKEEARENGIKGGKASGRARRRKKALNETIHAAFSCKIQLSENAIESLERGGYDFDSRGDPTAMDVMIASIVANAMNGDLQSAEFLARYGLIPDMRAVIERERIQATQNINISSTGFAALDAAFQALNDHEPTG